MCTAISFSSKDHYFGRNLDLDLSYGEEVCITPRNYPIHYRHHKTMENHYALIGMAFVVANVPLYFDAANEHGLAMAGLNFPGNACFLEEKENMDNITPFEFIPWILAQCKTVKEARILLERCNLINESFSPQMPLSPLHWMISDKEESIVVEPLVDGLKVWDNPFHVLTNNPPFEYHLFNMNNYRGLSVATPENTFSKTDLNVYCQGLGGLGLPGDTSSMSRFVRAVFHREYAVCKEDENSSVSQYFHLLDSVSMKRGVCLTQHNTWDITIYSCCINLDKGIYYYNTYDNRTIHAVDMHKENLDDSILKCFKLVHEGQIVSQN